MRTRIGVLVKKESFWTKATGSMTLIGLFRKSKIKFILDGTAHMLESKDEVYYFDVTPGAHDINFIDPKAKSKRRTKKFASAVWGSMAGLALGSGSAALSGALSGASSIQDKKDGDGQIVTLAEGDEIVISCKATGKGTVKLERLR